jgi:hypothetical protein
MAEQSQRRKGEPNVAAPKTSYELKWEFSERLTTEHLGCQKYSTSTKAVRELVANSLDADATLITIKIVENSLGDVDSLIINDNGRGISPTILNERFRVVGVDPIPLPSLGTRLGRFGVGRLAVHRIGSLSKWSTVSNTEKSGSVRCVFTLGTTPGPIKVDQEVVPPNTPTGTTIEILNLIDKDKDRLTQSVIANDLVSHYCSYLLANPNRRIQVQGEVLNVQALIAKQQEEVIPKSTFLPDSARLNHLILTKPLDQSRFPAQIIFSGKGRTVATLTAEIATSPNYLAIVECPYLDSIVTSNRDTIIEMDKGFSQLKQEALQRVQSFDQKHQAGRKRAFIQKARLQEFYPYRTPSADPVTGARQALYDVVLEKVNDAANIDGMTKRQQEVVFRLLRRSLENENVLEVLDEVAKLSDADMVKFRRILERTTLDSILKLASEVTHRLDFLDVLHGLVYGDVGKHVKERSQLHRILEPDCWIFGAQFHLAASDKSFREIIRQHRKRAGLTDVSDDEISKIQGAQNIPDLFLAATRDYPLAIKHHHALVELKAPNATLGKNERDQVRRYADTILDSHEFEKKSTHWDIFLVSKKCTKEIERDRNQKNLPHGCLYQWDEMSVWAFEWSEIITKARDEMLLVRDHLKRKSEELTVSQYLKENFPDILETIAEQLSPKDEKSPVNDPPK